MSMFKTMQSMRGVVTLFHDPTSAVSRNIAAYIQTKYNDPEERSFDIELSKQLPTTDQLNTIASIAPAFKSNLQKGNIIRPILVDWFNGKVAIDDEQSSKKILDALEKKDS